MPVSRTVMHGLVVLDADAEADGAAVLGELHGVAEQVDHHPLELGAVAEDRHRRCPAGRPRRSRCRPLSSGRMASSIGPTVAARSTGSCRHWTVSESRPLSISRSLIIEISRWPLRLMVSSSGIWSGSGVDDRAVGHHLGVADDAGHRRAQLVGDRRDELVLGLVERAQPLDRGALLVERGDQHLLAVPLLGDVAGDAEVAALGGERVLGHRQRHRDQLLAAGLGHPGPVPGPGLAVAARGRGPGCRRPRRGCPRRSARAARSP